VIDGFDWVRAWVEFDNGVWMGSISADKLVPADDWENFKVRRVQEAEEAERRLEEAATAPAAAPADAGGGDGAVAVGAASNVPATSSSAAGQPASASPAPRRRRVTPVLLLAVDLRAPARKLTPERAMCEDLRHGRH